MGGFALPIFAATSAIGVMSQIGAGKAQARAYEMESKQAEMQGQAQSNERLRALNDAISTQQAMFGAQGRVGNVGSAQAVQQGDIAKGLSDVAMIKAGAKSSSESLKSAGKVAKRQGYTGALASAGNSLFQYSMLGGKVGGE